MAAKQTASKAETPAAVKQAAARKARPPVEGPKGKKLETKPEEHVVSDEQRQAERRQASTNAVAQFTQQQMTTPAVHATPDENSEAIKQKAFQEAVQALANSMGIDASSLLQPGKVKAARPEKQAKNGITRPASETTTGKIWDLADQISAKKAEANPTAFCTIAELRSLPELKQTNEHTLKTQYARWRTYNGLKGRQDAAPATPQRRADDPKPEPVAQ
jgi:hypothetical protein